MTRANMSITEGIIPVEFPSDIRTGNVNVDQVKAIYIPSDEQESLVIVLHGTGMSKEDFIHYGEFLKGLGISSLILDLPHHGQRGLYGNGCTLHENVNTPEKIRLTLEQILSDVRKAISLGKRHTKIGLFGYSLGALCIMTAMGQDTRVNKGIAVCGGGDIADIIMTSDATEEIAKALESKGIDYQQLRQELKDVEPCKYAQYIMPNSLLMINGNYDSTVHPQNTKKFQAALKNPQQVVWYDCDHYPKWDKLKTWSRIHFADFLPNGEDK